ncbi:hypothetical protein GCM10010435_65980 [Winogradskya consettensis]|uniref:Pycsar effector protein domain-containing protein n=1 Tax=Winogradskya consettensis TaxID=113560 RepID=A0A919T378_9ACTN|nr:Pycsar system effector family protein [Actinoplanes consettensis]GIM84777.1 hypothetical protein Aco04nite_93100 [Actinoplanes consettensis]
MTMEPSPVGDATQTVRAELARVDAKAGTLLALAGTAFTVALAVFTRAHLPGPAVATGWISTGLIAAAVAVLALAIRPNLDGDHGFVHYAQLAPADLGAEFAALTEHQHTALLLDALAGLSRAAFGKYRRVQLAVDLLLAALAGVTLTAALAALL